MQFWNGDFCAIPLLYIWEYAFFTIKYYLNFQSCVFELVSISFRLCIGRIIFTEFLKNKIPITV